MTTPVATSPALAPDPSADLDEPPATPASRRLLPWTDRVPWPAVHGLSLVVAGFLIMRANSYQWFYGDDWEFIANRGPEDASLGLFTPHNEHWSTLPILIFRALLATVGLKSYLPYVAVLVALHLLLAHLVWRASLRAGASPAIATGVAAVFAILGAGAENLLWAFQIGFVGSIAFGWLAVLLHDHDGRFQARDAAGWLASITALMFSGPAIVMVGVATLTVWLRRRRLLDAALVASVPLVVFGIWNAVAGRDGTFKPTEDQKWRILDFAWTGLTATAETVVGIPGIGGLLIVLLAFWWARHLDLALGRGAIAAAGCAGALVFFVLTGSGRVALGIEVASASRYVYIAAALLLPGVALALSRAMPAYGIPTGFVLVACALVAVHNYGLLRESATNEVPREQYMRGLVVASAQLLEERDPVAANPPNIGGVPDVTARNIGRIRGYDWLPDVEPTPDQRLTAEATLLLDLQPEGPDGELGAVSLAGENVDIEPAASQDGAACATLLPRVGGAHILLDSPDPTWRVRLRGPADAPLVVQLVDGDVESIATTFALPDGPADLVSGASGRTVRVAVPEGGETTICGVAL